MATKKAHPKKPKNNTLYNDHFLEMLKYLSAKEKESFLSELLAAIAASKSSGDFSVIDECIEAWEDIAELNSIPDFKDQVWARFNELKDSGLIH